jgi:hypothetical protein
VDNKEGDEKKPGGAHQDFLADGRREGGFPIHEVG